MNIGGNKFSVLDSDYDYDSCSETKQETRELINDKPNKSNKSNKVNKTNKSNIKKTKQTEKREFKMERAYSNKNKSNYIPRINKDKKPQLQSQSQTQSKSIYFDNQESEIDLGNSKYLNSSWSVYIHDEQSRKINDWSEQSYKHLYIIDNIGSFWRFMNNFHMMDKINNQIFIMRNKIKPTWEDNNNKHGGICSIKIDCIIHNNIDMSVIIMTIISMLIMNETFIKNNNEINGISYSIKKWSVFIKVWYRTYDENFCDKIPLSLLTKLDSELKKEVINNPKIGKNRINIRNTPIKPEYDIES